MISIFLTIIGVFATVFLENIFWGLFTFSIFFVIAINLWNRVDSKLLIFFVIIGGLALDVTLHIPFGFNILILGIALLFLSIIQGLVPLDKGIVRYIALFFVFLFIYVLRFVLLSLLMDGMLPILLFSNILHFVIVSFVSLGICFLVDHIFSLLRRDNSYEKIRLR